MTHNSDACFNQGLLVPDNSIRPGDLWRAEMVRLTAFPAPGPQAASGVVILQQWWSKLFSEPFERLAQDAKNSRTQLRGTAGDAFIVLTHNPISFELRRLSSDPGQGPLAPATVAPYGDVVGEFQELAIRLLQLDECPPLRRLAFGAALLRPVTTRALGYETLGRYLPKVQLDPDSLDFSYHINRRRSSSLLPSLELNRLSKWSVVELQEMVLGSDGVVFHEQGEFACRVELDMNSVPSSAPLSMDLAPNLFGELVQLATEVANSGDIP